MKWTEEEILYLAKTYSTRTPLKEISKKLGRSIKSIKRKSEILKISRPRKPLDLEKKRKRQAKAYRIYYAKNSKKVYERKKQRRNENKRELVKILGGKCSSCGYDKCIAALEFHHHGIEKWKHVARLINNNSKQKALKEIEKCLLLCANCHREVHQGIIG